MPCYVLHAASNICKNNVIKTENSMFMFQIDMEFILLMILDILCFHSCENMETSCLGNEIHIQRQDIEYSRPFLS